MEFFVCRTSQIEDEKPCEEAEKIRPNLYTVKIENLQQLMEFCDRYGEIVITPKEKMFPTRLLPTIEIYDAYRE